MNVRNYEGALQYLCSTGGKVLHDNGNQVHILHRSGEYVISRQDDFCERIGR